MTRFDALLDIVEGVTTELIRFPANEPDWLEIPVREYALRYARAAALMDHLGLDALVLSQPSSVRYFTGLRTWFWALPPVIPIVAVLPRDPAQATLVDTETERGGVERTTWISDPSLYGQADDPLEVVARALRDRGLGLIGLELGRGAKPHMSPNELTRLQQLLGAAQVRDASELVHAVRALKTPIEIDALRRATTIVQVGFQAVYDALVPGITEIELTRVAAHAMLDAGAVPSIESMILIFMAGADRYRQPLQPSSARPVREGELISLDGGCLVDGYHSDFARCAVIGELPARPTHLCEVTIAALEAAIAAVVPGALLSDAWRAAQAVLNAEGVGGAAVNPSSIGHGIGMDHWEPPLVARPGHACDEVRIRAGMVLCVEPQLAGVDGDAAWREGLFLVEDQFVVNDDGAEVLTTQLPRPLFHA